MNTAPEIDIAGITYRINKIDALAQFHLARKLGPVIATLGQSVNQLAGGPKQSQEAWLASALGPVSGVIANMSHEDADFILHTCLSAVGRRQDDGRFAPIQKGKQLMFADIEMPTMLRLATEMIKENLGGFFTEAIGGFL